MIGLCVIALGWVATVVALILLLGLWPLVGAGVATMIVGALVDLDRVKESPDGKRRKSTS